MSKPALSASQQRECEGLAQVVAPELAAGPLYVTNLPANYPDVGDTMAFTTRGAFDFALRRHLIDKGRWRGPGTVIAFCQPMSRDEALGLVLHEVSHAVPFVDPPLDFDPSPAIELAQRQLVEGLLVQPVGASPAMPLWYAEHGLQFVRRCLHVHHRAWQAGFEVGLPMIGFAGEGYDLSLAWRYLRAIGDEPERMAATSFRVIDATPAPTEFSDLFQSDIRDWCERTGRELTHVYAA